MLKISKISLNTQDSDIDIYFTFCLTHSLVLKWTLNQDFFKFLEEIDWISSIDLLEHLFLLNIPIYTHVYIWQPGAEEL